MLRGGDGATHTLLLADGPVLLKGAGALDGGLVDARALEDLVRALVGRELAFQRPRLVRRQLWVRVDDVVLNQRVPGPAVDAEVSRAGGVVGAAVFDGSASKH